MDGKSEPAISCDGCGRQLHTFSQDNWRLVLKSELYHGPCVGTTTCMYIEPPQPVPAYFCHHGCLFDWLNRSREPAARV